MHIERNSSKNVPFKMKYAPVNNITEVISPKYPIKVVWFQGKLKCKMSEVRAIAKIENDLHNWNWMEKIANIQIVIGQPAMENGDWRCQCHIDYTANHIEEVNSPHPFTYVIGIDQKSKWIHIFNWNASIAHMLWENTLWRSQVEHTHGFCRSPINLRKCSLFSDAFEL